MRIAYDPDAEAFYLYFSERGRAAGAAEAALRRVPRGWPLTGTAG